MTASDLSSSTLFGPLLASGEMRSLFSDRATVGRMLQVEAALAAAEAAAGVIPRGAAAPIAAACDPARYDLDAIGKAAPASGNVAIALVKALTAEVTRRDAEAARFVHWGATSQDIIDTATSLAVRDATILVVRDLDRAAKAFAAHARRHRNKPMAGRTWLQQALPVTFGLKAARYATMLVRARNELQRAADHAAVLQFGGAAGTLASLGKKGQAVAKRFAAELDLALPDLPWHGERDRIAAVASALGIVVGAAGKIARDISLLMQTEVAEVFEPSAPGRGGSSTMPHKRNPVASAEILTAATLAPGLVASVLSGMVQEHERALGGWQAEWVAVPQLFLLASGATSQLAEAAKGLEIDTKRMRDNLEFTNGLVMAEAVQMALGEKLGRMQAHDLLEEASKKAAHERRHLREVVAEMPQIADELSPAKLDALFDPAAYLGSAGDFIDNALASVERALARKSKETRKKR